MKNTTLATSAHTIDPIKNGRCIALFPGAFRPPHKAHILAVRSLCECEEIDEIVIIISNRWRHITGTNMVLGPQSSKAIWKIILTDQAYSKVRVEVAHHTAISYALSYFQKLTPQDQILFCLGKQDYRHGDDRFIAIKKLSSEFDIKADLRILPTGNENIRSSELRKALPNPFVARALLSSSLPPELSTQQRNQIQKICEDGQKEISKILSNKLKKVLHDHGMLMIKDIHVAGNNILDSTFKISLKNGTHYYGKYTGDAVHTSNHKPSNRISIEKRALSRIHRIIDKEIQLPEVVIFDKKYRTLIVTDACPHGEPLEKQIINGICSKKALQNIVIFLNKCHQARKIKPIRKDFKEDITHWHSMLGAIGSNHPILPSHKLLNKELCLLHKKSSSSALECFMLLDNSPSHYLIDSDGKVARINFEYCSSFGDPAYDLGEFLAHIILATIIKYQSKYNFSTLSILNYYKHSTNETLYEFNSRVINYIGAHILKLLADRGETYLSEIQNLLQYWAIDLLKIKPNKNYSIVGTLQSSFKNQLHAKTVKEYN